MIDMLKIGKFISECRKNKNLTQAQLAEKLEITDRAVSKWENGKSLPDAGIMLDVCEILGTNVNELLSGEKLDSKNYKEMAEKNLISLAKQEEKFNKKMLRMEFAIGYFALLGFLIMLFFAEFIDSESVWKIALSIVAFVFLLTGVTIALKIEQSTGYYECKNCHKRYVPTMKSVYFAPHFGRTRYMKCPHCKKRSWQKKVFVK